VDARSRRLALLLLGALPSATGCGLAPRTESIGPGLLLVVVDGLRADHISCAGYDRPTTPTLDLLAADGLRFASTFAAAPLSIPAFASLLTGSDPTLARRFVSGELAGNAERDWHVPAALPRLAAEFLAARRSTAAFVDDPTLTPFFGLDTGFQLYDVAPESAGPDEGRTHERCVRFLRWVQTLPRGKPWFALLHFSDLERCWSFPEARWETYFAPRPELSAVPPVGITDSVVFGIPRSRWHGTSRTLGEYEASYDGQLCKLDRELGELLAGLRRLSRYEDTTVSVVGSFGMQLGEAGLYLRSGGYSLADLHVPWILRPRRGTELPGARGRTLDELASTMDVAPTLLAIEGLAPPRGMLGLSLRPLLEGRATRARPYVFAACGLIEGGVVIGPAACLEVLFPGELADEGLRRGWFGAPLPRDPQPALRFYRWRETPFPPLAAVGPDPTGADFLAMWKARSQRVERLRAAQYLLQRTPYEHGEVDPALERELGELGYLGAYP
jgi:hypothetical protein